MLNIIARNVKTRLEKKVNGNISIHAIGDTIVCDIVFKNNAFRYTEKFTKQEIAYGLCSAEIANNIIYQYTLYIRKKFFK